MPLICVILARLPQCLGGVASVPRYRCLQASFSSLNSIELLVVFFHLPILKKRPPWIFLKFMFICLLFFVIFFYLQPQEESHPSEAEKCEVPVASQVAPVVAPVVPPSVVPGLTPAMEKTQRPTENLQERRAQAIAAKAQEIEKVIFFFSLLR